MSSDRIPVLVFDDGGETAPDAFDRAAEVASSVVLATVHDSTNRSLLGARADELGLPTDIVELPRHTGIRHALELCAERQVFVACVPHPLRHEGELLRKCVQSVARAGEFSMPSLAVRIVRPGPPTTGPVVELTPARTDAGFVALFAVGLAISTRQSLQIVRLGDDGVDETEVRASAALDEARRLIAEDHVPVLDERDPTHDWLAAALRDATDASAVVVGLGGFTVRGRKLTAPDEIPDGVLETREGRLVHELVRHVPGDVVVVIDSVSIHSGTLPAGAAATAVTRAIGGGATGGSKGLAVVTGGLAATGADLHRHGD